MTQLGAVPHNQHVPQMADAATAALEAKTAEQITEAVTIGPARVLFQHPTDGIVIGEYTLDQTTHLPTAAVFRRADDLTAWVGTVSELEPYQATGQPLDQMTIWPTAVTYVAGPGAATNTAGNFVSGSKPSIVQVTGHPTDGLVVLYKIEQDASGVWKWERL